MVVQGTNVAHLLELQALAMSLSLPTYLVQDAGLTQVRGNTAFSQLSRLSVSFGGTSIHFRNIVTLLVLVYLVSVVFVSVAQCLGMKTFENLGTKPTPLVFGR